MGLTKVTRNYQITLPKDIRKSADIRVGDEIIVHEFEGEIRIKKVRKDSFERAFGIFKKIEGDSVDYVRQIRQENEKRMKRLGL